MHGLGNDFLVIEDLEHDKIDWPKVAMKLCDRHFGIGADGILLVQKSESADIKMSIINSDGSTAEMCGNGVRCFSKYVYQKGIVRKNIMEIETLAGPMIANLKIENNKVEGIKINMGSPLFDKEMIPFNSPENSLNYVIKVDGRSFKASTLLIGVPHTVIYVDDIDIDTVINEGKKIEQLDIFPAKTNVNFVKVVNNGEIEVRTWERGAGLTLACGTGTCASVVACYKNNLTGNVVKAHLAGGDMNIEYDGENVYMEGPAEFICEGRTI